PAVPDRVQEVDVADPGQLRLRGERHGDPIRQVAGDQAAGEPAVAGILGELPGAVEVQPTLPSELGAGVLGSRDVGHELPSMTIGDVLRQRRSIVADVTRPPAADSGSTRLPRLEHATPTPRPPGD